MPTFDLQVNSKSMIQLYCQNNILTNKFGCFVKKVHFAETHRKTSNFDMCVLNFFSTCHLCFIQKIIYHLKRIWPRFSLPKFYCSSIYVITFVKFRYRSVQNLLSFPQRTSMDFSKVSLENTYLIRSSSFTDFSNKLKIVKVISCSSKVKNLVIN